jgi:excisionase family DNA binding protein
MSDALAFLSADAREALEELIQARAREAVERALDELDVRGDAGSPLLSIPEAAEYLRSSRQRVDDLLSAGRLTRIKEGRRTLIERAEIEHHLESERCR